MGRVKTLKEFSGQDNQEPVTPATFAGQDTEVIKNEHGQSNATNSSSVTPTDIDHMISTAFDAARLKVAQDMLESIMANSDFGPEQIAEALQNDKLKPFLPQLQRCWGMEQEVEATPAPVRRRGRPPQSSSRIGRAAKADNNNMSKGPRKTRVRLSDEEREAYNNTVYDLIKASGKEGIYKQELMASVGKANKRWADRGQFLTAALDTLKKKIIVKKDGVKVYYTAA